MNNYAYLDFCSFELCNLTCEYCRTSNKGMQGDIPLNLFTEIVNSFLTHSQASVFKVSGYGEISLWIDLVNAMQTFSNSFSSLQVMTNGTIPKQTFEGLVEIENLVFCITIDGHTLESNRHRNRQNEHLHKRMFDFVFDVIKRKRKLEINCVLSAANIENFPEYVMHIRDNYPGMVMIMPFPVRPFVGLKQVVSSANKKQVDFVAKQILVKYKEFDMVLPPLAYMERLFEFMHQGERSFPCFIPIFNYGVGPKLKPLTCACLGHTKPSDDLSNMIGTLKKNELADVSSLRKQHILKGYVDERCRSCFTHYEVLNLFFEGAIKKNEMHKIPSFSQPTGYEILENAKGKINS